MREGDNLKQKVDQQIRPKKKLVFGSCVPANGIFSFKATVCVGVLYPQIPK